MSIEVSMLLAEMSVAVPLQPIRAGQIATMSDYSLNSASILTAHCFEDDSGGEFYYFPNDGFAEDPRLRAADLSCYTPETKLAVIGRGGRFEHDILTSSRRAARLIFQHVVAR